jgi:outer membrane protein TolC
MAKSYHDEILPKSQDAYRLYFDSFQQKRAAWPQVLDSQRKYYELYENYLNNLLEARRAEAQIATFFVGGGLDEPSAPTPAGHRDSTPKPR